MATCENEGCGVALDATEDTYCNLCRRELRARYIAEEKWDERIDEQREWDAKWRRVPLTRVLRKAVH